MPQEARARDRNPVDRVKDGETLIHHDSPGIHRQPFAMERQWKVKPGGSEAYGANYSSLMKHALQEAIAVGPLEF